MSKEAVEEVQERGGDGMEWGQMADEVSCDRFRIWFGDHFDRRY